MFKNILCKQVITHIMRNRRFLFNEKLKMLKHKVYNAALDYPLFRERLLCKKMCYEHNMLSPEKIRERNSCLTKILKKTGKVFLIEQPFMCDYGYNIEIGENFASNHNLLILDSANVKFGKDVMVGPNCSFITTNHPLDIVERKKGLQWAKPITIKDNVWICANVTVLSGVTIGENSIIAAGSVVTKNIPPNSLAMGVPCKVVKFLNS